jgi:phage/plasmid-like protein (TIGR03299 family)
MGHGVDVTTGKAALAYAVPDGVPWHVLGDPIDRRFTVDELKQTTPHLFFALEGRPVYALKPGFDPLDLAVDVADAMTAIPGLKAITRADTGLVLGVTSKSYREYDPESVFRFGEALVGEGVFGSVAGSLLEGRLVFITFTFDEGDAKRLFDFDPSPYFRNLVVSAGNDGRHALRAKNSRTRTLCYNTYLGHLREAGREVVIRHTSQMETRIEDAKRALGMAAKQDEAFIARMTDLSKRDVDWEDVKAYLAALFPVPNDDKPHTRIEAAQDRIRDLFFHSPNLDGVDRSAYRLFQATAEYADHFRSYSAGGATKADARAAAVLDGAAQDIKDRALAVLSA